ncbi:MAG TPA: NAD(P)H-dependent oxidoreductase subunit E [Bacteroidales bacterium]|jgi:NADH:ubiquinone oxidoreductase subunit E|nr:NAD(P)H-dependent oxidoreductase subunit E [Bacteroidales bacterium]
MKEMIENLTKKYGKSREALIPILQAIVEKESYLSEEAMNEVAKKLDISAAQVYGTASFYSFLDTEPRGKYVIRVCKSIIAEMKGKKEIIKTLENLLKIKVGQTTPDNLFSLLETNDIGWSDQEPSMLINEKPYTNLTPEKAISIINEYRK